MTRFIAACTLFMFALSFNRPAQAAQISREELCVALDVHPDRCTAVNVEILGAVNTEAGKLRITRIRDVAEGTLFTLRTQDSLPFAVLLHEKRRLPETAKRGAFAIRAGQIAELIESGASVRLHRKVVSLNNAVAGDVVRVREVGTHRIFRASVATDGTLRGDL